MRIMLYCFGAYPHFLKEVVRASKDMEWSAVIPTYHFKDDFIELLGKENVLYLQEKLNRRMVSRGMDMSRLSSYHGCIYRDIATDKSELRKKNKAYQLDNAYHTYIIFKEFLERVRPDAVFFPIIETHDGMILYSTCKELGIETVVYTYARNLGVSFLSQTSNEELPSYAYGKVNKKFLKMAADFVGRFREKFEPPGYRFYKPKENEVIKLEKKPMGARAARYALSRIAGEEPHYVSETTAYQKLKVNLLPITKSVRALRGDMVRKYFDISTVAELPERFVYYPLQLTPESSINALAPYFVDQTRAIDMLLYNLPSDQLLVVKEHPAMLGVRPSSFYEDLRRKAGLVLANPRMPSIEVAKRAALTVSVTGTACLEAFLMGKPSMHLGRTFFTDWISQCDSADMKGAITRAIGTKVPDERVHDLVARVFMVSKDFVLFDPTDPYLDSKYVMNTRNVGVFLEALQAHLEMVKERGGA